MAALKLAEVIDGIVTNVILVDPAAIPDWCAAWPEAQDAGIGWLLENGVLVPGASVDTTAMLAEAQAAALSRLAEFIAAARTVFITVLPGQDMIYLAKEAEAKAWVADAAPDLAAFPLLSAEVGITAPDADQLAQLWLNMATLWRIEAARLEALRMSVTAAVSAAGSVEEVELAMLPLE